MADRMKRWFRGKKNKSSAVALPKDPYWGDKRSRSIPRSWENSNINSLPNSNTNSLPRHDFSNTSTQDRAPRSRARTPNGSLEGYYLESNIDLNPYPTMQNGPRSRSEPRFKAENMDNRLRARDHGYYMKAAGLKEEEANKENVKMIYDRSRMTSPNRTGYTSAYTSRYATRQPSRNHSFRSKDRIYRPNKRSAPVAPSAGHSRQNSHETTLTNGDVGAKVTRKKRKAPPPPTQQSMVQTEVYPIEPPVDYDRQVTSSAVPIAPPPPPIGQPPQDMVDRSDSPEPPPLPPREDEQAPKGKKGLVRMDTVLRKDIVKAAENRKHKGPIEPGVSQYRNAFKAFENELSTAVEKRNKRRGIGTLRMRYISRSKMFKAQPSRAEIIPPETPAIEDMLERAHVNGVQLRRSEEERRMLRQSARVETHEWTPAQDLDDVFDMEPTTTLTQRGSDYYDIDNTKHGENKGENSLYRKAKYAKPNRNSKRKSGNLDKLKKSIGKAFGSIGKSLHRKGNEIEDLYPEEEGWQIQYSRKVDPPPVGPIAVERIEKHPAYAYHAEKGQLVLLPDYDRIVITKDGKRVREADIAKSNKEMPAVLGYKQRPALEGLFESGGVVQKPIAAAPFIEKERTDIELMEEQFEQVRRINRKETGHKEEDTASDKPWRSTPDLTGEFMTNGFDREGVLSDYELEQQSSKNKKKKRSVKKSKKSSTSSDGKSPRQKVLRKGLDYYLKQPKSNSNPVYSSDDEGVVHSDPNSESSNGKPAKADSLGDSGIGQESLNSSAASVTHAPPIPTSFMQAGVDLKGNPLYYASAPSASAAPPTVVMTPGYTHTPNQYMYPPHMYYPGHVQHVQPAPVAYPIPSHPIMSAQPINLATTQPPVPVQPYSYMPDYHSLPRPVHHPQPPVMDYNSLPRAPVQTPVQAPVITAAALEQPPADIQNHSQISSDSASTLVASDPANTSVLNDTTKSSSKVINVTENIALVSYQNSESNPASPRDIGSEDDQRKKQYLMGPVGYRPIKFDPSVKSKPITLPERTLSFNSKSKAVPYPFLNQPPPKLGQSLPETELRLLNGDANDTDKVLLNGIGQDTPMADDFTQVLNDKPTSALSSMLTSQSAMSPALPEDTTTFEPPLAPEDECEVLITADTGVTKPTPLMDQDTNNNYDQPAAQNSSSGDLEPSIPSDVMEKYGHEDLVAL